jgi:hypothetical protein
MEKEIQVMNSLKETYESLIQNARSLAQRWVNAWPKHSGYNSIGGVQLIPGKIAFRAIPITSGMGWYIELDSKYLDNSTDLEFDSQNWYQEYLKKQSDHRNKLEELEQTPEVKEYLRLKQTSLHSVYSYSSVPYAL